MVQAESQEGRFLSPLTPSFYKPVDNAISPARLVEIFPPNLRKVVVADRLLILGPYCNTGWRSDKLLSGNMEAGLRFRGMARVGRGLGISRTISVS